jgi:hypothetical protein
MSGASRLLKCPRWVAISGIAATASTVAALAFPAGPGFAETGVPGLCPDNMQPIPAQAGPEGAKDKNQNGWVCAKVIVQDGSVKIVGGPDDMVDDTLTP